MKRLEVRKMNRLERWRRLAGIVLVAMCLAGAAAWGGQENPVGTGGAFGGCRKQLSFAEAEKVIFPGKDVVVGWGGHQISRGGTSMFYSSTTEYDYDGNEMWSNWTMSQSNHSGTILAVPIGDYKVEQMFEYSSGAACKTGVVASVEVQLSTGAKKATDAALHSAVKNLACSGMSLSTGNGGKPSHLMALKRSSARRFAGKNPRVHYDAKAGKVYLVLEDCQFAKWDATYVPGTPDGASKSERERLAKLCRDEDKGGFVYSSVITEIHPVGSSHIHDRGPENENHIILTK